MLRRAFIAANAAMTAVFLLSAGVQYNDPDPARWVAVYGVAALVCIMMFCVRMSWLIPGGTGMVALVWAGMMIPQVREHVVLEDIFASVQMKDLFVEQAREIGGLLIVAGWMAVLTAAAYRRAQRDVDTMH